MTTTPEIRPVDPASDEEIADTFSRANRVTGIGSVRALKLIARIKADRARIAELEARTGCEHCSDRRREAEATIAKQAEEIERLENVILRAECEEGNERDCDRYCGDEGPLHQKRREIEEWRAALSKPEPGR